VLSDFQWPSNLVQAVEQYHAGLEATPRGVSSGGPTRAWLALLPALVQKFARRWQLDVDPPFQPGGVTSWVARARTPAGERVVLKVAWPHDEALHEAEGLRAWAGNGAVSLLDVDEVAEARGLLLEACEPGTTLSLGPPPEEQDEILAGLLRRLWINPPPGHPLRTLHSMCAWWANEYDMKYAASQGPQLDPGLSRAGIELFRALPGTAESCVLLCTDLHPENVLAAKRERWLVIDPKPYVGDPVYDALQHILNFPDRLVAEPVAFARRMADLLDIDAERLLLWLFARCVQESVDQPYLNGVVRELAP